MTNLPLPSSLAREHSEKLTRHICEAIEKAGGQLDFARFMELALYAPGLGYYTAGTQKFGRTGDFVTAPEISPLFARCFARQFQPILASCDQKTVLEVGAGSGIFAKDLLCSLEKMDALPDHYIILEVSLELRERQRARFERECPAFLSRISWLDTFPTKPFRGIVFANEVLDAMPVHRFEWSSGEVKECVVAVENNEFIWRTVPANDALKERVMSIQAAHPFPDFYRSEVSFVQPAWIHALGGCLAQGGVFLVDYGYGRGEYYHPERQDGTLMCFYQHRRHTNPLIHIGLQDITAHVDFTTIAESADQVGLQVAGFTTQAAFLLDSGLLTLAEENTLDAADRYTQNQAIKTLTLPSAMGEVVKVMALTRDLDLPLPGFALQDRRQDL